MPTGNGRPGLLGVGIRLAVHAGDQLRRHGSALRQRETQRVRDEDEELN
jgi:hypothetical protein